LVPVDRPAPSRPASAAAPGPGKRPASRAAGTARRRAVLRPSAWSPQAQPPPATSGTSPSRLPACGASSQRASRCSARDTSAGNPGIAPAPASFANQPGNCRNARHPERRPLGVAEYHPVRASRSVEQEAARPW